MNRYEYAVCRGGGKSEKRPTYSLLKFAQRSAQEQGNDIKKSKFPSASRIEMALVTTKEGNKLEKKSVPPHNNSTHYSFSWNMKKLGTILILILLLLPSAAKAQQQDTVKLGLALSGGAARGYVHLGVLQAFDEEGIQIDVISGTSMGAIIGLFYSAGYTPMQIMKMIKKERMDNTKVILKNNHIRDAGYADYRFLRRIIYKYIPHNCFDSLETTFYCCVTNINKGISEYVGHGNYLAHYVTASASFPILFAPVILNGTTYVDGCVLNDLPIEPLQMENCNVTIGSYLQMDTIEGRFKKRNDVWSRIMTLYMASNIIDRLPLFTYTISNDLHGIEALDFDQVDNLYQYGYEAGKQFIKNNPELRLHRRKGFAPSHRKRRPEE